jgi:hypothetical protein
MKREAKIFIADVKATNQVTFAHSFSFWVEVLNKPIKGKLKVIRGGK